MINKIKASLIFFIAIIFMAFITLGCTPNPLENYHGKWIDGKESFSTLTIDKNNNTIKIESIIFNISHTMKITKIEDTLYDNKYKGLILTINNKPNIIFIDDKYLIFEEYGKDLLIFTKME